MVLLQHEGRATVLHGGPVGRGARSGNGRGCGHLHGHHHRRERDHAGARPHAGDPGDGRGPPVDRARATAGRSAAAAGRLCNSPSSSKPAHPSSWPSPRCSPLTNTATGRRSLPGTGSQPARSLAELAVTAVPFVALWLLMWLSLGLGYWLTLLLAVPAAGFLVRLFMIQHDCGHGSFFRRRWANDWLGRAIGVLTLTAYDHWRQAPRRPPRHRRQSRPARRRRRPTR